MRIEANRRTRTRARILILATTAVAAVVTTASAIGATTAKNRVTVPAQSPGTATAECDPGRSAVAGGFASPQFSPGDNGGGVVRLTSKVVGKDGVTTKGFNFGRDPSDLVSFAYCVKHAPGLEVRRSKVFVGPGDPISTITSCPRGTRVVGGGFGTQGFGTDGGGPRVITLTSRRVDLRHWRVEAINLSDDGGGSPSDSRPGTLLGYAYCVTKPTKLVTKSKRVAVTPGEAVAAQAKCPDGGSAYSGGFDGNIKLTSQTIASGAITSKRADGGHAWRVKALGLSDTVASHVTVYAYCRA